MSQQTPEGQGQNINEAYRPLLDAIPEVLHTQVIPIIQKMSNNFDSKVQSVRDEYKDLEAFKPFVENNVDANYLIQSYNLAKAFEDNPEEVVKKAVEMYELDFVNSSEVQQVQDPDEIELGEGLTMDQLAKLPVFQQLQKNYEAINEKLTSKEQEEQREAEIAQVNSTLNDLEKEHGNFNRLLVTAFMSQGLSGEQAVAEYNKILADQIAGQAQTPNNNLEQPGNNGQPPVVMGQEGASGSGSPENTVNVGTMSTQDLNSMVSNVLAEAQKDPT
jgi:hypothetical protein